MFQMCYKNCFASSRRYSFCLRQMCAKLSFSMCIKNIPKSKVLLALVCFIMKTDVANCEIRDARPPW